MSQPSEVSEVVNVRTVEIDRASERRAAYVRLTDTHLDVAYRLARVILQDSSDAEDATHDAFVQAWRKLSTLREPDLIERWFDRILVNTCRNRLRRSSRQQTKDISGELALSSGDPHSTTHDRDVMRTAIASLSPDHRTVVVLRYYRDLSVDQIARRLEIPSGTVQSRLHYALKRLRAVIDLDDAKGTI